MINAMVYPQFLATTVRVIARHFVVVLCLFVCLLPVNQSLQALQASAAQVRLEPTTKMPQRISVFYLRQPGVTRKDFTPRKVCICVHASVCAYMEFSSRRIL